MDSRLDPQARFTLVMMADDVLTKAVVSQLAHVVPGRVSAPQPDLRALAAGGADQPVIWALPDPVEVVARTIAATGSVAGALAAWKVRMAPALAAARKMRRRLSLVDARALALGEAQTVAALAPAAKPAPATAVPALPEPVFLLLASAAVQRDPEAARYVAELAALRRGAPADLVDMACCEAAARDYALLLAGRDDPTPAHMELENRLLRENLALQIEQLAAAQTAAELAMQEAVQDAVQAADQAGAQAAQAAVAAKEAELTLATAKIKALQRQLDDATAQAVQRDAAVAAVLLADQRKMLEDRTAEEKARADEEKARADAMQEELQRVYASRSWRVTGPLRALRGAPRR